MFLRKLFGTVSRSLQQFPAVAIIGPRQSGKTTLAQQIAKNHAGAVVYLDLERPSDVLSLRDPETFFRLHRDDLVILDEIQTRSDLFPQLRSYIDEYRRPGRFLMLGSACCIIRPRVLPGASYIRQAAKNREPFFPIAVQRQSPVPLAI